MTSYKAIQRAEDYSALAITARERLTTLGNMLHNIHAQGRPLSDYNLRAATEDIAATVAILWQLQNEICRFKGEKMT